MSVRGYADWKPKPDALYWLRCVLEVLDAYRDDWPLTNRQIFYRLVADYRYEKTENAYGRLTQIVSRARRAGMLPWDAIRDGGLGRTVQSQYFEDQADFEDTVKRTAKAMKLDRQRGQEAVLELWCEAGGMVPILQGIAAPYTARVNTGGGYDSVTAKHRLAERVRDRAAEGLRTVILHVGDFDASGEDMADVLRDDALYMVVDQVLRGLDEFEDVPGFVKEERGNGSPEWSPDVIRWAADFFDVERVALTGQQVIDRQVETAPPKRTDSRTAEFVRKNAWVAEELGTTQITAQLEALTPPELRELLTAAIEEHLDMDQYARILEEEEGVRKDVLERLER